MNRAKRSWRQARRREIETGVRQIQLEGQGVFRAEFIRQEATLDLIGASLSGNRRAIRMLDGLGQFLRRIATEDPSPLCLLCPAELTQQSLPGVIVILVAEQDAPSVAIMNGICKTCAARSDPELHAATLDVYRQGLISDLRPLPPMSEPGRA